MWEAYHVFVRLCSIEWVGGVSACRGMSAPVCSYTDTFSGLDVVLYARLNLTFSAEAKDHQHCDLDQFSLFTLQLFYPYSLSGPKYKVIK